MQAQDDGRRVRRQRSAAAGHGLAAAATLLLASLGAAAPAGAAALDIDGLSIPADAPSLVSFEAASLGTYDPGYAAYYGLVPLLDDAGRPVAVSTPSGVVGSVYLDPVGNVLVAYAWTNNPAQNALAVAILSGIDPALVPGYADATQFLSAAEAIAVGHDIPASRIYVTGFSLGGMLSSYVASQTGLPGVSFAASGLPGYRMPGTPATNFVSFIEAGDPVGQYGTDSAERSSALHETAHMDHYGIVLTLGQATAYAQMNAFSGLLGGNTVPGILAEPSILSLDVLGGYDVLTSQYHQMTLYSQDANALAAALGIDPTLP